MLDRISASVDLYSHLRLEVTLQAQQRARPRARHEIEDKAAPERPGAGLYLEADERRRSAPPEPEENNVVLFQQSATLDDQAGGGGGTAEEVIPALEASARVRDPRMAYAAAVYSRNGRVNATGLSGSVGTRLNAVA